MMKPETRTKNLMTLLGWQGGTIHDACKEIGCDVHDFLYGNADFSDAGPCHDFRMGYGEAKDVARYLSKNRGNLQYWLGAVSAVQNGFETPNYQTNRQQPQQRKQLRLCQKHRKVQ